MHRYSIVILPFLILLHLSSYAQKDSLIIKGQIQNLNGRLYRQASFITFSRNNILLPQAELSKQAPLQADGSFRVSLPIFYEKEEIYLDYGGKAFSTFLGSAGTINISFNGDSLGLSPHIFHFSGPNAETNNLYSYYQEEEKKAFASNKTLGANFFNTLWRKDGMEASAIEQRKAWRKSILTTSTRPSLKNPPSTLRLWTDGIIDNEASQSTLEVQLSTNQPVLPVAYTKPNYDAWPLTYQKVTLINRYGEFADLALQTFNNNRPDQKNSLPVKTMANLFLDHVSPLSPSEREKLMSMSEKGSSNSADIDFMSTLFSRNQEDINLLFDFEREKKINDLLFREETVELLSARFLTKNFFKYTYQQQILLNNHIQKKITSPIVAKSLAEAVSIELKDTASIKKFMSFQDSKGKPVEVLPGYWGAYSGERGNIWVNEILKSKLGKTIYLILWDFNDPESRQNMDYIASLRARVPSDIEFVYMHGKEDGLVTGDDLVKQFIIRHRMTGTHLFMTIDQMIDVMMFKVRTSDSQAFSIVQPNGKFKTRNAPAPSEPEKLIPMLIEASR